jgi:hypothetical protein
MGSSYETNNVDEFLKHKTTERGGQFLKNWKEKSPPEINTVLHMKRMPVIIWQHGFPRIVIREDKDTKKITRLIWGGNYKCREDEKTLKKQYHRNDDGTRKHVPTKCPLCRLIELVRDLVEEEKLDWRVPIFKFVGDEDTRIIHAGGIFGAFKQDDLTDEEIKQLKDAGIKRSEAFMENVYASCKYIFCIVDADDPGSGVQIATVTSSLGDKVKEVINDRMKDKGSEQGNPWLVPFCIQWEYRKHEQEPNKKYKARPISTVKITPAIEELIRSEPPDLSNVTADYELKTMRAYLERYCLINELLDWDYIFDVPIDEEEEKHAKVVGELKAGEDDAAATPIGESRSNAADDEEKCPECGQTEKQGCPHVMCDACEKVIRADDAKCKHCGKVFVAEPAPPPAPAAPAGRKRRGGPRGSGGTDTGDVPPFAKP